MNNCEDCKHWQPKTKHRLFKSVSVEGYCKRISENTTYRDSCFRFTPMRFKKVLRALMLILLWSFLVGIVEFSFGWVILKEWNWITPEMTLRNGWHKLLGAMILMGIPVVYMFKGDLLD